MPRLDGRFKGAIDRLGVPYNVPYGVRPYVPLKDLAIPVVSASVRAYARGK